MGARPRGTGTSCNTTRSVLTSVQHLHKRVVPQHAALPPCTPLLATASTQSPRRAAEANMRKHTGEFTTGKPRYSGKPVSPTGTWTKWTEQ